MTILPDLLSHRQSEECRKITEDVGTRIARWIFDAPESRASLNVGSGFSGEALYLGVLDRLFPGSGWDKAAYGTLKRAVRTLEQTERFNFGLFTGVTGLAFAARYLSLSNGRYNSLVIDLNQLILDYVETFIDEDRLRFPCPSSAFDVISGIAGVGIYLTAFDLTDELSTALHRLVGYVASAFDYEPNANWLTPVTMIEDPLLRRAHPKGLLNCGVAHGQPGVLGFLCFAAERMSMPKSLQSASDWLVAQIVRDADGINWPHVVSPDIPQREPGTTPLSRAAWCYGAPGISRILSHAADVLDDERLRQVAQTALLDCLKRTREAQRIEAPIFCHGLAGLALIAAIEFTKRPVREISSSLSLMVDELTGYWFDRSSQFGFFDVRARERRHEPGLLGGAAGVGMVLAMLCLGGDAIIERLFLLS